MKKSTTITTIMGNNNILKTEGSIMKLEYNIVKMEEQITKLKSEIADMKKQLEQQDKLELKGGSGWLIKTEQNTIGEIKL